MKIVIVGGGTAGWMAACYFARYNHSSENVNEIVVIESSKIPIIGAGEGSTGLLAKVINREFKKWGITENDFLYNTASTLKLGIRFKDWNGVGTEFLSPVQPSESALGSIDTHLLTSHFKGNYYDASPSGFLMQENQSTYSKSGDTILGHSYHFDAHKVGQYFKNHATKHGVKVIDAEVESLQRNPQEEDNCPQSSCRRCRHRGRPRTRETRTLQARVRRHQPIFAAHHRHCMRLSRHPPRRNDAQFQRNTWRCQEMGSCAYRAEQVCSPYHCCRATHVFARQMNSNDHC